jgi:AraC-like DNA-binding protein
MDVLADILTSAGLRKRVMYHKQITAPWMLQFPCSHSMGFHVITLGEAYLWKGDDEAPVHLHRGDIAFMARGKPHRMSTHPDPDLPLEPEAPPSQGEPPLLAMVNGIYQLWNEPIHPFFQALPDWVILRAETIPAHDPLQATLQLLSAEMTQPDLGSQAISDALLDVLFHLMLRRTIQHHMPAHRMWQRSTQDPYILKALQLMHSETARDWSLDSLANAVGLSRSGFALKFKQVFGDTPLHYLTTLRMQKAMELLAHSDQYIEAVAAAVGYQDALSFSRAFKKSVGKSPREFRRRNQAELGLAWRFA